MISPEGVLGQVPDSEVSAALEAGFRVMANEDLARMHQRSFLAEKFFDQKHPKIKDWRLPRGRGRW